MTPLWTNCCMLNVIPLNEPTHEWIVTDGFKFSAITITYKLFNSRTSSKRCLTTSNSETIVLIVLASPIKGGGTSAKKLLSSPNSFLFSRIKITCRIRYVYMRNYITTVRNSLEQAKLFLKNTTLT